MTNRLEHTGDTEGQMALVPPQTAAERQEAKTFDEAVTRVGQRFEEIIMTEPMTQDEAIALLDEIEWRLKPVLAIEANPKKAAKDDHELLVDEMEARGTKSRRTKIRKLQHSQVPTEERVQQYDEAKEIGRRTVFSGPDKRTVPAAAVTRHWLKQETNAERLEHKQAELEDQLPDLPSAYSQVA